MDCLNNLCSGNGLLWLLLLFLVLGGADHTLGNCTLPILLAVLFCLIKNGAFCNLFRCGDRPDCGCGCG